LGSRKASTSCSEEAARRACNFANSCCCCFVTFDDVVVPAKRDVSTKSPRARFCDTLADDEDADALLMVVGELGADWNEIDEAYVGEYRNCCLRAVCVLLPPTALGSFAR
jgi:hypothetical protein